MSVVTYAELCAGLETQQHGRDDDEKGLAPLAQRIPVLPFIEASERFGILRAAICGRCRGALDGLIAAIAADAVLVTDQEADFRDDPGYNRKIRLRSERGGHGGTLVRYTSTEAKPNSSDLARSRR